MTEKLEVAAFDLLSNVEFGGSIETLKVVWAFARGDRTYRVSMQEGMAIMKDIVAAEKLNPNSKSTTKGLLALDVLMTEGN